MKHVAVRWKVQYIRDCNIKRTCLKPEKVNNTTLQEFRKHSKISLEQERGEWINSSEKATFFSEAPLQNCIWHVNILTE